MRALVALLGIGCGRVNFDINGPDPGVDGAVPRGFSTVCDFANLTAIDDGQPSDTTAGNNVAIEIAARCNTGQTRRLVAQDEPGILDPTTSQLLLAPDDLAVVGGGNMFQRANQFFVGAGLLPITHVNTATEFIWTDRATGTVIVRQPFFVITPTHDYGVVAIVRDPAGPTMLTTFGIGAPGTLAAAYLFTTSIVESIATEERSWVVFEWTNRDGDLDPTPNDTFTVLASGF